MQINVRQARENSKWSQVVDLHSSSGSDTDDDEDYVEAPYINQPNRTHRVFCKVGENLVDVDYIDCGLLRGQLEKFISSPYLNLSNPWLVKVIYIHAMNFFYLYLISIPYLIK